MKRRRSLHALGVSQLLAGRYDDAAQSLLAASREQPANARYLSDVAAVQLERARLGLRPDDLPRALAAADRARRLDPSLKEAWFNRALAASALSLTAEAKAAWTEYLQARQRVAVGGRSAHAARRIVEADAGGGVGGDGRPAAAAIDASTADEAVRTQTTEARNFIERTLLREVGDAVLEGEQRRRRARSAARDGRRRCSASPATRSTSTLSPPSIAPSRAASRQTLAEAHRDYAARRGSFIRIAYAAALADSHPLESRFGDSSFAVLAALTKLALRLSPAAPMKRTRTQRRAGRGGGEGLRLCGRPRRLVPRPDRDGTGPLRRRPVAIRRCPRCVHAHGRRRASRRDA